MKELRRKKDLRKQDFTPTSLEFGPIKFYLARHFGFCYGVENAIEISYRAIEESRGKRVFLLSQMIHNQEVNRDLQSRGVNFIMDTDGTQFVSWNELHKNDIVIVPAFGTTVEIEQMLLSRGISIEKYNTTCPFVEKVWNRSHQLSVAGFTTVIHGKPRHEETRATFSHSAIGGHAVVVRDMEEAKILASFIHGQVRDTEFELVFNGRYTQGFVPSQHLTRVGVVNQTTMLAKETEAIADFLRQTMMTRYGAENLSKHFADTRDTLCYATNDNQDATYELLNTDADLAIVVGGYNSSNTSHIVELCARKFPTYFINSEHEIISKSCIQHFDYVAKSLRQTTKYLPDTKPLKIILTSGASCPDTVVDRVMLKLLSYFPDAFSVDEILHSLQAEKPVA